LFGIIAYLTQSILPGVVLHAVGIFTFFTLIWPKDSGRMLISQGGSMLWFWLHSVQTIIFFIAAVAALIKLKEISYSYLHKNSGVSYVGIGTAF
jgi:hypothetical protein